MSDIDYIEGLKSDNQKVIGKFYEKFEKDFKKTMKLKFHTFDDDLVADVYQDAIVRLWENVKNGVLDIDTLTTTLAGYLYGIGVKVMLEVLRKKKEVSIESLTNPVPDGDNDWEISFDEFEKRERESALKEVVNGMGKPCKPLLVEFYWYGLSWEKIATKLGYSNADSAKTQKNKCMSKLKSLYKAI